MASSDLKEFFIKCTWKSYTQKLVFTDYLNFFIPKLIYFREKKIAHLEGLFAISWHENAKSAIQKLKITKKQNNSFSLSIPFPINKCINDLQF